MKMIVALLAVLALPAVALAQNGTTAPALPRVKSADRQLVVRSQPIQCVNNDGNEVPCSSPRESFRLVNANTPSAAVTVYGGDYALSQQCTGYGTLTLQARAADGSSYITLLTKSASDTSGATGLALGSYAVVRITVSGTTGCNAILARVPA